MRHRTFCVYQAGDWRKGEPVFSELVRVQVPPKATQHMLTRIVKEAIGATGEPAAIAKTPNGFCMTVNSSGLHYVVSELCA